MEYPSNYIDMFEFSQSYGRINEAPAKIIFSNLLHAVRLLIDQKIFHRDLKDENILLNPSTLDIKIIDFGCATHYTDTIHTRLSGTPEFMPPEAIEKGEYTAEGATVWSLGVILFTLINGRLPYEDIHNFNNRTEVSFFQDFHPKIFTSNFPHNFEPRFLPQKIRNLTNHFSFQRVFPRIQNRSWNQ